MKEILKGIWTELAYGAIEGKHPFRTFVLANTEGDGQVRQRTVVLRKVESYTSLTFYTDSRSGKIKELNAHNQVSILFYDAERRVQLSCQGIATIEIPSSPELNNKNLSTLKDYTTVLPPGSIISEADSVDYNPEEINFATVEVALKSIEYLELSKEGHTRIRFDKENDSWEGQYLVP